MARAGIELNGVRYRWPSRPVVVVTIDGGDPAYFAQGVRDGIVPNVARFMHAGFAAVADGDVPSFTCPNNMSIATGSPPAVHGISGNFYLDRETGAAVMMTGPELLRSRTILAEFSRHGATVVSITAKDKLRAQLGKDMDLAGGSVNFSSECADQCTLEEHGIENVLEPLLKRASRTSCSQITRGDPSAFDLSFIPWSAVSATTAPRSWSRPNCSSMFR